MWCSGWMRWGDHAQRFTFFPISMVSMECDICGFQNSGNLNFCGGCGVDMREPKKPGEPKIVPAKDLPRKKGKGSSKDRKPENEKVIH